MNRQSITYTHEICEEQPESGLDVYLNEVNKSITNKCNYATMKTSDNEYMKVVSFDDDLSEKIGEIRYAVQKFLDLYPGTTRFLVEFDTSEKHRRILARYFPEYLVSRNEDNYLLFRLRSRF